MEGNKQISANTDKSIQMLDFITFSYDSRWGENLRYDNILTTHELHMLCMLIRMFHDKSQRDMSRTPCNT